MTSLKSLLNLFAALASLTCSLSLAAQAPAVFPLDKNASSLKWTGHAEVGTYSPSGTLSIRDGHIDLANGRFSGAVMTIDMASMQQSNADLLHHLKSPDFFDVEHFPVSLLKLDKLSGGAVSGTLTVRGKTAPLQAPVTVAQNGGRFLITGKVRLDRTQYGIVYNSSSLFSGLGDKAISNYFEVEFTITGIGVLPPGLHS